MLVRFEVFRFSDIAIRFSQRRDEFWTKLLHQLKLDEATSKIWM